MKYDFENDPEFRDELDRLDKEDAAGTSSGPVIPTPRYPATSPLLDTHGNPWVAFGFDPPGAVLDPKWDTRRTFLGMWGRYWTTGWHLIPAHDIILSCPLVGGDQRTDAFEFAEPLRCLGGITAVGWDGTQWATNQGPRELLCGPVISPHAPVSQKDLDRVLCRVPPWFANKQGTLTRRNSLSDEDARSIFQVELPSSLLEEVMTTDYEQVKVCWFRVFLQWYCGISPAAFAILLPPDHDMPDFSERLDALVVAMSRRMRELWDAVLAGDECARRDFADMVEMEGDTGRASLLRIGLDRYRQLDADWLA